jgi:hypothetical protein
VEEVEEVEGDMEETETEISTMIETIGLNEPIELNETIETIEIRETRETRETRGMIEMIEIIETIETTE